MDKETFKEIGLTNNETEVYLTLLKTGSSSVNTIAEKSGLHRQAVYDALDRLLEKGFVSFAVRQNKKYFQGIDPERILDYLEAKKERFRSLLSELIKMTNHQKEDTKVEIFKGKRIANVIYKDVQKTLLDKKGEVLITGIDERKFIDVDEIALQQHIKTLEKLGFTERLLSKEGDVLFVEGKQSKYRWMPNEYFNPTPIYVYGNKLAFLIWGTPNYAIIIENETLADSYRKQFNLMWKHAKKVPKTKNHVSS